MTGGRLLAILGAIMIAIAGAGYLVWKHGGALECVDRTVEETTLAAHGLTAVVYERDCGGAIATHVALRPAAGGAADDVFASAGRVKIRFQVFPDTNAVLVLNSSAPSGIAPVMRWRNIELYYGMIQPEPCKTTADCDPGFECLAFGYGEKRHGGCFRTCDVNKPCPPGLSCTLPLDAPRACRFDPPGSLRAPRRPWIP